MPSRESKKNISFANVASEVNVISISNSRRLKPFSESFSYAPVNVVQQPLGNLFGFFKIRDASGDSAYIVNFLTAVIKKEYYINARRSPEDSFDAALHKVNLALSEIARDGNVNWLGKLEAAAAVLFRNNLLFTVCGNARVLLSRRGILNDISEGLAETEEIHPLKTFINISSGRLKAGDKLIATSDDIFRILSFTEIQKGALRFPAENFSQFLHTALVNKLEAAETIVVDVFEKENLKKKKTKSKEPEEKLTNVFSEKAFQRPIPSQPASAAAKETGKKEDYVDKKTGHIYIQEEEKREQKSAVYLFFFAFREKLNDFFCRLASRIKLKVSSFRKKRESARLKREAAEKAESAAKAAAAAGKKEIPSGQLIFPQVKKYFYQAVKKPGDICWKLAGLFPRFSKIKRTFLSLDYNQRILGIAVLAAVAIIPWTAVKIMKTKIPAPVSESPLPESQEEILAGDKNISFIVPKAITAAEEIFAAEIIDKDSFFISPQKIIQRGKNGKRKDFNIPLNYGRIILTAPMEDLNLIFLLTDQNKIISFSPVSREFKENKISLPGNVKIKTMAAYLTYLYLADAGSNRIYRYPRAEGGFGAGASWLKKEVNLNNVSDIAIDENIYLTNGDGIIKLFKGGTAELNFESSATPIKFNKIFTNSSTANIYVLDDANGRLVKFAKSGEIISQYHSEALNDALDLTVDEKNNKAFIVTSGGGAAAIEL